MSISTVTSAARQQEVEMARLREQLQRREFHLAELIDEVVYAEQEKEKALAVSKRALAPSPVVSSGAASLEQAFRELLRFDLTVFSEVMVPVLLGVVAEQGRTDSSIATMLRHDAIHSTLEALLEDDTLETSTRTLIYNVLRQSSAAREASFLSATQTPAEPVRVSTNSVQLERAVVLSGLLLRRQHDLLTSLSNIRTALNGVYDADVLAHDYGADVGETRGPPARASATAYVRKLEREREALQLRLLDSDQRHSIVDALVEEKKQLAQEVVQLQQKLIDAHVQLSERSREQHASSRVDGSCGSVTVTTPQRPAPAPPAASPDSVEVPPDVVSTRDGDVTALQRQLEAVQAENQQLREALASSRKAPGSGQLILSPPSPQTVMREKVNELELLVSSLRGNLHTMESRVETLQNLRERERERIMARHEQELARIFRERDECAALVQAMSSELHTLAKESRASTGRSSLVR